MHDERHLALLDTDRRRLVRAAARLLGPAEAEDAVQDAFVRALEADTAALNATQAWLLTVVRNLAIDRLRRRRWMQQWLEDMTAADAIPSTSPSAEDDAALSQEAARALHLLAARLSPADGAALLLHEVFEVGHAEIALASGRSEAGARQQLRRALLRLRQAGGTPSQRPAFDGEAKDETPFHCYLQALQLRDPRALWGMLRQPPVSDVSMGSPQAAVPAPAAPVTACGVVQLGGQLRLVLTLDGVTLCVLPLGVRCERVEETTELFG